MFIGLYAVIGILAVISAVSVGMNIFLWKRRILTTKTEENIYPPAPHPVLISNEGTSYDELSIARSDTDVYLTITHEYENGGVHV